MTTSPISRMLPPAERLIREQIAAHGPLTFARFVEMALYHPLYGYYNQPGERRGRGGDYFTSLQVSPLFPAILATAIQTLRDTVGTDQFSLVEIGSGNGEFLEGVLAALDQKKLSKGFRVWSVEKSRPARDRLWRRLSRFRRVEIVPALEDIDWLGGLEGCVFSNEFMDAVAFHRLRKTAAGWKELYVDSVHGVLTEVEGPLSSPDFVEKFQLNEATVDIGHDVEVRPSLDPLFEAWSALFQRGYVLTVDYGHPRSTLWHSTRSRGTLRCFSEHRANEAPLDRIGKQDITAHVDFTHVAQAGAAHGFDPLLFCSQGLFLSHIGAPQIDRYLKEASDHDRRVRAGQVQQLVHPDSMGEAFSVLLQAKGVPLPPDWAPIPNRLSRLSCGKMTAPSQ